MRYRYRVLALLFLLSIITYLDRVCISVAGASMQKDLGLSASQWGWVVGVFALSYALFEIPSGALGDRIGPRRVLARIVIWWSFFTSLTGAVSSFWTLVAVRFAFGAGEAGAYPNSSASISRWFPLRERARATGAVWTASRIGGAVSPLIMVPIIRTYGWRSAFYLFGGIGIVWAIVWFWWYRDHPAEKAGISQAELDETGGGKASAHAPLPWKQALARPNLWWIMAMYHAYCWGSFFYLSWLHTYLTAGRGLTTDEMKVYSTLPFIAGAFGNLLGGYLSDVLTTRYGLRAGRVGIGMTGLAVSALCILGTALTGSKYVAVGLLTLGYFSMDCMLPSAWSVCMDVGRKHAGAVSGAMNMAGQLGSFISSVVFGHLVDWSGSYNTPLYLFAFMLSLSAFLFTRIDPTQPVVPDALDEPLRAAA